jgi:hypothetical protein
LRFRLPLSSVHGVEIDVRRIVKSGGQSAVLDRS